MVLRRLFQGAPQSGGGETRVHLQRLLEDIRQTYPVLEEAIITELVANALDAQPSQVAFVINSRDGSLAVIDDGAGMNEKELEEYHDIAATTKVKGKGIGFAGLGAKLSLLLAEVITETKTRQFHGATRWRLESELRAPWKWVFPQGRVRSATGSAVTIVLKKSDSPLLNEGFIQKVIQRHYHPLLDPEFREVLKQVYKRDVKFYVNSPNPMQAHLFSGQRQSFLVTLGRRLKPVGVGFIQRTPEALPEEFRGVAVSTFGKVIKRGWDWLGIMPRNPSYLTGIVEIPALSEILTTNKVDFLKDATSLQKFYRYRKAVQQILEPILRQMGEIAPTGERVEQRLRPLEREIERVLEDMLPDFPEIGPLLGRGHRGEQVSGVIPDENAPPLGTSVEGVASMTGTEGGPGRGSGVEIAPGPTPGERIEPSPEGQERGQSHDGRKRRATITIYYDEKASPEELGRLEGNALFIHTAHPAYRKAAEGGKENYHVHLTVAWVLSGQLEEGKSPLGFLNRYLSLWGQKA